jgi:antitoxin HicB
MKREAFRYRILVEWSDEDQAFVARVRALPGCLAHGPTAEKATHEAEVAAGLILDVMKEGGKAPPPVDAVADYSGQLRLRLPKSLHETVSQLATAEGVSINTLMLSLIAEGCGRREEQTVSASRKAGRAGKRKGGLVARKRTRLPHHVGTVYQRGS